MTRQGSMAMSLLDDLHAERCDHLMIHEYSRCHPVVIQRMGEPDPELKVIYMEWCGECGAADWDYV